MEPNRLEAHIQRLLTPSTKEEVYKTQELYFEACEAEGTALPEFKDNYKELIDLLFFSPDSAPVHLVQEPKFLWYVKNPTRGAPIQSGEPDIPVIISDWDSIAKNCKVTVFEQNSESYKLAPVKGDRVFLYLPLMETQVFNMESLTSSIAIATWGLLEKNGKDYGIHTG